MLIYLGASVALDRNFFSSPLQPIVASHSCGSFVVELLLQGLDSGLKGVE
jgi:hypothetical protein